MAIKIYQPTDAFQTVVDATAHDQGQVKEKTYTNTKVLTFGFNGDVCWVKDLIENKLILNAPVTDIQNEAGDLTQTKAGVETFLLTFIGG